MKTIYLVRHGQSEANIGNHTHGDHESPLTERGIEQAMRIAERCERLHFELILASDMRRAQQTAHAIRERTGKPMKSSDLFRERRVPTIIDESKGERTREEFHEWTRTLFEDGARHTDGENFSDIRERAVAALRHLEALPQQRILVVTHGFFLRALLAAVIFGDQYTPGEFVKVVLHAKTENTGLTVFNYAEPGEERYDHMEVTGWFMRVWNDHAHLG